MTDSRLTQTDVHNFLAGLEQDGLGKLEKNGSLQAGSLRLWLTLLDDTSSGQLRLRKLVLSIPGRVPREWFSVDRDQDRWQDLESDGSLSSAEVLELVRAAFVKATQRPD